MQLRTIRIAALCAGALALAACSSSDNSVVVAPTESLAFVRFVHAVPDTGATDWSFVDVIENSPKTFGLQFRGNFDRTADNMNLHERALGQQAGGVRHDDPVFHEARDDDRHSSSLLNQPREF